jgi:3-methyl-2-oxobutanoate hydroxymethyltransferase
MAKLVDTHCDIVVGDSVGMVLHGLPSTLGVTLDMMIMHGQAVRRGVERALMLVDMPFGSYEGGPEQAFRSAARLMTETGCAPIKLKGGESMASTIRFLAARGIPVAGCRHISSHVENQRAMQTFRWLVASTWRPVKFAVVSGGTSLAAGDFFVF